METTPSDLVKRFGINPQHALDECYGTEISLEKYNAQIEMLSDHPYYCPGKFE